MTQDIRHQAADISYDSGGLNIMRRLRDVGANAIRGLNAGGVSETERKQYLNISRQMDKTNVLCRSAANRARDHILGPSGITPTPQTGIDGVDAQIEDEVWGPFAENPELTGRFNWRKLQEIMWRDTFVAGDELLSLLGSSDPDAGKLQYIEAERLTGKTKKRDDGTRVDQGRVVNARGQTVRWNVAGVSSYGHLKHTESDELSAANCLYVSGPYTRATQVRAYPQWIASMPIAHQVDDIMTSEAITWQSASRILAEIETEEDYARPALNDDNTEERDDADDGDASSRITDTGYAMIFQGRKGEKFNLQDQQRPSNNFEKNLKLYISMFCLPLGLAQEILMLDFGDMNYSSFRGMLLQAFIAFRRQQIRLIEACEKIYKWQIDRAIADGRLTYRPSIYDHTWDVPGWPWIDENKEVEAWAKKIDRGIATQSQALASLGESDVQEHRDRRKQELIDAADAAREVEAETDGLVQAELIWKQFAGLDFGKTEEAKLAEALRNEDATNTEEETTNE